MGGDFLRLGADFTRRLGGGPGPGELEEDVPFGGLDDVVEPARPAFYQVGSDQVALGDWVALRFGR